MVYENCSELTIALAMLGGAFLYFLAGALVGVIISKIFGNNSDTEPLIIFGVILWPFVIVAGLTYLICAWITAPLWAASKDDLRNTEDRLSDKIDDRYLVESNPSSSVSRNAPFKVGDIITGIVPQTDSDGSNISYEHLYQGCKCRVLSIDRDDSMKVILIGHKDKEAHSSYIGKTFTAPARNFTKVRNYAKKKVVKKKSKR